MTTNLLDDLLSRFGLISKERQGLSYLLERGARSAGAIAKATGIKRPTVYSTAESLISYGVVTRAKRKGRTVFSAASIDHLPTILENRSKIKFEETLRATSILRAQLEDIKKRSKQGFVDYEVEYYDITETAYLEHFEYSLGGDFCAIFNPNVAVNKVSRPGVLNFLRETSKSKANLREIAVDGEKTKWYLQSINNENHQVKLVPEGRAIRSNIIMRDGVVNLTHYSEDGMTSMKITHQDYYDSMKTIFEMLWEDLNGKQ